MIKYKAEEMTPKETEKGSHFKDDITGRTKLSFITRKKGIVSGRHYHEGKAKCKNPEILFLVQGKAELTVRDVKTGEEEKKVIKAPAKMQFWPFVYHELLFLDDSIMVELGHDFHLHKDIVKVD